MSLDEIFQIPHIAQYIKSMDRSFVIELKTSQIHHGRKGLSPLRHCVMRNLSMNVARSWTRLCRLQRENSYAKYLILDPRAFRHHMQRSTMLDAPLEKLPRHLEETQSEG